MEATALATPPGRGRPSGIRANAQVNVRIIFSSVKFSTPPKEKTHFIRPSTFRRRSAHDVAPAPRRARAHASSRPRQLRQPALDSRTWPPWGGGGGVHYRQGQLSHANEPLENASFHAYRGGWAGLPFCRFPRGWIHSPPPSQRDRRSVFEAKTKAPPVMHLTEKHPSRPTPFTPASANRHPVTALAVFRPVSPMRHWAGSVTRDGAAPSKGYQNTRPPPVGPSTGNGRTVVRPHSGPPFVTSPARPLPPARRCAPASRASVGPAGRDGTRGRGGLLGRSWRRQIDVGDKGFAGAVTLFWAKGRQTCSDTI